MEPSTASHIEKLTSRDSYATWKFVMEAYLQSEDLWGCVTGEAAYLSAKKMTKARAKIILSVEKQNYSHLQNTKTPQETWQKLKDTYEDTGLQGKFAENTNLNQVQKLQLRNQIMVTAYKLKELDFEVKNEMVAAIMLLGLPDNYKPMLMGLERSGTRITLDAVKVKLLQEA